MTTKRKTRARKSPTCTASPPCAGPCITVRVKAGGPTIAWSRLRKFERNTLKSRGPHTPDKLGAAILGQTGRGFAFPIFVWSGHDYVFDGAGRVPALERMEEQGHVIPARLPVSLIEAESESEAAELVLLVSSHYGEVTEESLLGFAEVHALQLEQVEAMVAFQGLAVEEVARRQAETMGGGGEEEDEIPDPPADPVTRPGDMWVMGGHRLVCGDSTSPEVVEQLFGEERAGSRTAWPSRWGTR